VSNKKIIITGASGLLGRYATLFLNNLNFDTVLFSNTQKIINPNVKSYSFNLMNTNDLEKIIVTEKPDYILHTAGITDIEKCEHDEAKAFSVNVDVVKNICDLCIKYRIFLVYISTDHLYQGNEDIYTELSPKCPINIYAKTKSMAEDYLIKSFSNYLIIRTNFFGWGSSKRKSFTDYIIDSLRLNLKINLFDDVFFTPILIDKLLLYISILLEKNASGIFNISSSNKISKYAFGNQLCDIFSLDKSLINKSSIKDNNNLVQRPLNMSLSNEKLINFLDIKLPNLEEQFKLLKCTENKFKDAR
jgi:dTDP-4-dehydrorhamnose reductase